MKLSEMLEYLNVLPTRNLKRKRRPNWAGDPNRHGVGLWMKDAFDLVIAKQGCIYARKHKVENDRKIEGHVQAKEVKICNGCIFLEWDEEYGCSG